MISPRAHKECMENSELEPILTQFPLLFPDLETLKSLNSTWESFSNSIYALFHGWIIYSKQLSGLAAACF